MRPGHRIVDVRPSADHRRIQEADQIRQDRRIRIQLKERHVVGALGFRKERKRDRAKLHGLQPERIDRHRIEKRAGDAEEDHHADQDIGHAGLPAGNVVYSHAQQDHRHAEACESVAVNGQREEHHGQVQHAAARTADEQQVAGQQQRMRHDVAVDCPAALQNMPRVDRDDEQRQQRKALAEHPAGEVPDDRQHGEAHKEHRQAQGELGGAEQPDKRHHNPRIERGHVGEAPRLKVGRPAGAQLIHAAHGQAVRLHAEHQPILIVAERQLKEPVAAGKHARRHDQRKQQPVCAIADHKPLFQRAHRAEGQHAAAQPVTEGHGHQRQHQRQEHAECQYEHKNLLLADLRKWMRNMNQTDVIIAWRIAGVNQSESKSPASFSFELTFSSSSCIIKDQGLCTRSSAG